MKNTIKKAIYGAVSGAMLLPTVVFGDTGVTGKISDIELPKTPLIDLLKNALNIGIGLIGLLGVLVFLWAGILYLTSGGDSTKTQNAKKAALYGALGIAVALIGYIIVIAIEKFLSGGTEL